MADIEGSNGQRTEFKAVGRANIPGRLSYSIATGMAKFGCDYVVPDMLHAKFLRNPYGRAKINSIDTSKALELEGVVDIITWEDPEVKSMKGTREPLITNESDTEDEEIGAVVVAETPELCDEALKLLKIDWEVFPTIVDPRDGLKKGSPVVRIDPKKLTSKPYTTGDVEAGFREADHIFEFDWGHSKTASHIPNPNGSVSWWAQDPLGTPGKTLYIEGVCPTWGSFQLLPMYDLHFDKLYRGTTFQGGKYCDWFIRRSQLVTPLLAKRTGRPVRCVNERRHDYYPANPQRYSHTKIGFKRDGTITAVDESTIGDSGAPGVNARAFSMGAWEAMFSPFNTTRCVNLKSSYQSVYTSSGKNTGSQTSPFNWDVMTIAEQIVAEKLGMDVIDVALKNIHGPSSQQDPGIPPGLKMCVDIGKKAMNWKWHPAGTKRLPDGRMHGFSFRYAQSPRHAQQPYTATVTIQADSKVYVPLKGPWMGNYAADACALVVAEEMGAKVEDVILLYGEKAIFTPVGGGSDGTSASAWVMKEAAVACKKLLLELAATRLKVRPEDLDTRDTMVYLKSIETYAVETRSGNACYGASGISHCMAAPLLPVCAVANAIGKWIEPPVTPDKILRALGKC